MSHAPHADPPAAVPTAPAQPLQAIAGFAAHLREAGLRVGVAEQQALVQAALAMPIDQADLGDRGVRRLRAGWRALACHRLADWQRWDTLFDGYWFPHKTRGQVKASGHTRPRRDLRQLVQQLHQQMEADAASQAPKPAPAAADTALQGEAPAEQPTAPRAQGGASRTEALVARGEGERWLPQELAELNRAAEDLARRLRERLLRRQRADARGHRLDLRRTLRASLATGGLPLQPAWRAPRRERPRLHILVDVSRSMETHAQLFLRIARAFVGVAEARVFVFHTRLAEVTPLLQRDTGHVSGRVQEKVNAVTAGFGGGTRIASSLAAFRQVHARGQLGREARVWILSDGFDSDPAEQLAQQLQALRSRGARITWLHPTRQPPASAAMAGARALVHAFAPLHDLPSLRRLEAVLQ